MPKSKKTIRRAASKKGTKSRKVPRPAARKLKGASKVVVRRAKPAKKARRVVVRKPVVHVPEPTPVSGAAFVVQMDKSAAALPIDPVTGRITTRPQVATTTSGGMTYAASGVDIHREDKAVEALAGMVNFTRTGFGAPLGKIGHFAGLIDFGADDALVLCTDGVGSKVEIANALRKWDTVGIDCMAMNVNDALCVGAEPLAFVDYLALQDPDPELTRQIGVGLNEGARQSNCSLIGGETASLPGIVKGFDLAGTCLAHVKKSNVVDGSKIVPGDVLIGLASTGIHSNGYSLARRAFESGRHAYTAQWPWPEDKQYAGKRVGDVLLEPTRIYVKEILALLRSGIPVHGLSHITGSGLRKLRRINQGVAYHITDPLPVQPVFRRIQQLGTIDAAEMYKTFNMGMGFVVVVPAAAAKKAVAKLQESVRYDVKVVGKVREGQGVHHPVGGVH